MTTARDVVERLLDGFDRGAWSELADLYAEDAVVERPFAAEPERRVAGRDELRHRFAAVAASGLRIRVTDRTVYETTDPEVVVAESGYEMRAADPGRTANVRNIHVFRIRDGKIQSSRDYHDHAAIAAVRA
jgi:ketosteroid isomerase-like protein